MANEFSGLFKNNITPQDVYDKMGQEREARIRQAMADNISGGGNYYSSLVARANQQMAEALRGGVDVFGTKAGILREDPRLAKARKLATDKKEIIDIIGKFSDPTSPGGSEITEQELKVGFAELMKRGYPNEAQQFMTNAMAMRKWDIESQKAQAARLKALKDPDVKWGTTKVIQDANKNKFYSVQRRVGTGVETVYSPIGSGPDKPEGKVDVINDNVGQTGKDKLADQLALILARKEAEKETTTFKSQTELKEEAAKRWNQVQDAERANARNARSVKRNLGKVIDILESGRVSTGGIYEITQDVKDFFGLANPDLAEIRYRLTDTILEKLKETGTRPTDADLAFIRSRMADIGKPNADNVRILTAVQDRMDEIIARGDALLYNNFPTQKDFDVFLAEQSKAQEKPNQEKPNIVIDFGDLKR